MRHPLTLGLLLFASPALAQTPAQSGRFPQNDVTKRLRDGPTARELSASIQALQRTLTELQQLQLQTKQAHWNVSGTLFRSLHEQLQEHYEGVAKYADEVAERLLQVGSSSDGRAGTIVRTSRIPEFPGGFVDDAQVIAWFTRYYHDTSQVIGEGIKATNDTDPTTANLLQEVQHAIDKYQWQMRAFLQPTPTDPNTGFDINGGKPVGPIAPQTPTNGQ